MSDQRATSRAFDHDRERRATNRSGAVVVRGDARSLPLADASVDLIVTSPPYFALRSYQDGGEHYEGQIGAEPTPAEFVAALLDVTRECMRVLKPSGSMWVNLGDKYGRSQTTNVPQTKDQRKAYPTNVAATGTPKSLIGVPWRYALACIDQLGLILRAEVIWSKPNALPESVTDRVRRSHETWFHFTKEPRYFSAVDEVREQYGPATISRYRYAKNNTSENRGAGLVAQQQINQGPLRSDIEAGHEVNPLGKLPGSVWTIPTEPLIVPDHLGIDHFAAFPSAWPNRIIRGWSPDRGVVLDPFGGTGTTAMVAVALGRTGISVDLSADYCRLARWRTSDLAQHAKVRGEDFRKPEPQIDGQADLFGDVA